MIACFGELLMRLNPPGYLRFSQVNNLEIHIGGSEANVSISLANFGLDTQFITRLPDNDLAKAALGVLNQRGVVTENCLFGGERMGLYFLENGAGNRAPKVVYDRTHSAMTTIEKGLFDWKNVLKETKWLHWSGITPAISQSAADATMEAISIAKSMNIVVSCDLNYRANLWQYGKSPAEVMPEMMQYCDVVLGDGFAFDHYFSIKGIDNEDYLCKMASMFPHLKQVAMTSREGFSASHNAYTGYLLSRDSVYNSETYNITHIVDRIGSGDAFMSGLIYGLLRFPDNPGKVVEFAAAAAVLKHYIKGDFNLSTVEEVEGLMSGNTGGKVKR
jgi:2-dehydro-3-deoxygluconokinase